MMSTTTSTTTDHLQMDDDDMEEPFLKGSVQPPAYRDKYFAYAFFVQIGGVLATAAYFLPALVQQMSEAPEDANENQDDGSDNNNNNGDEDNVTFSKFNFFFILGVSVLASFLTTAGLFSLMIKYPTAVVQICFASAPILLMAVAVVFAVVDPDTAATFFIMALFFAFISALVYLCYRRFIPFAASTLHSAVSAIQYHKGLLFLSFGGLILSFATSTLFLSTFLGIFAKAEQKGEVRCKDIYDDPDNIYRQDDMCLKNPPSIFAMILLILGLFWTQQVIQNVMHVTTAGTVGAWWFTGLGDPSCCSADMRSSLSRATTYSFGSICMGSLLVAIVQTLEEMAKSARNRRDGAIVYCIIQCILACIRQWIEYFNSWAFCYVGLYGYDYLTAGKNVLKLFTNRGWSSFIADRLVFRVLYASQLTVALTTGALAALFDAITPMISSDEAEDTEASHFIAFFLGFFLGLILSSCSLFVVESAVRTIIICFAESPADFQEHHPVLCEEMRRGWAAAYPEVWEQGEYDLRFAEATVVPMDGGSKATLSEEKEGLMT